MNDLENHITEIAEEKMKNRLARNFANRLMLDLNISEINYLSDYLEVPEAGNNKEAVALWLLMQECYDLTDTTDKGLLKLKLRKILQDIGNG